MNKNEKTALVPKLRFPEFSSTGKWEIKSLGEIGKFIGGGTPDTSKIEYWDGEIQWFTPSEIKEKYPSKSKRTITEKGLNNSSAKLLPEGTLLITSRATVGEIGIADAPCATNQGFQSLLVNDNEYNIFWYYCIAQHKNELVSKASGSTFIEIGKTEIAKILVLRPNKKEQQKIADCLSSLDDIIAAEDKKLDALKAYKKGLMQKLLAAEGETVPQVRFEGFAKPWKMRRLGDFGVTTGGTSIESEFVPDGKYKVISIGSYSENSIYTDQNIRANMTAKTQNRILNKGDLTMILNDKTSSGNIIGRVLLIDENDTYVYNQRTQRIEPNHDEYDSEFLYQLLNAPAVRAKIVRQAQGNTQIYVNWSVLRELTYRVPCKSEQQKIADCLSGIDDLIAEQAKKIETLKQHKKGLMQGLFPSIEEVGE